MALESNGVLEDLETDVFKTEFVIPSASAIACLA